MAVLTCVRSCIVAMLPLLVWHLLREPRQLLTLRPQRGSDQRMATPAEACIAYVVAPGREVRRRRGVHDGLVPFVDVEGPVFGPQVVLDGLREHHIPHKGRVRSH